MSCTKNYHNLSKWLRDPHNKAYWDEDLVVVKKSKLGGYGVFANKNITPDPEVDESGLLLRISKEAILSGPNSKIANYLYDSHVDGIFALILALLYEKSVGKDSPWYEYINSIDFRDPATHTLLVPTALWSLEDRQLLEGTDAEMMGVTDPQDIEEDYSICLQFAKDNAQWIKPPYELTPSEDDSQIENDNKYQLFAAACFAVSARAFLIDDYHQLALVPAADLFNHDAHGREDVHFIAVAKVCPFCGQCDECGHDEYGPPDSEAEEYELTNFEPETEDESEGDTNYDDNAPKITQDMIEELDKKLKEDKMEEERERQEDEEEAASFDVDSDIDLDEIRLDPDQCCDIKITKKVKKGQELMNCYGALGNAPLLSKYGFTVKNNPNDSVCLGRQIIEYRDGNDKFAKEKLEWWSKKGFALLKDYKRQTKEDGDEEMNEEGEDGDDSWLLAISIMHPHDPSPDARCVCKLLAMNEDDFKVLKDNETNFEQFVQKKMDSVATSILAKLCQRRLLSLPGLQSDTYKKFTEGKLHDRRKRTICTLLKDEKAILEKCIGWCSRRK